MSEIYLPNTRENDFREHLGLSKKIEEKAKAWVDSGMFFWKGTQYGCPILTSNLPTSENEIREAIANIRDKDRHLRIGYQEESYALERPGCLRIWESPKWVEKPGYYFISEITKSPEQVRIQSLLVYINSDRLPEIEESICTTHATDPKSFNPIRQTANISQLKRFNSLLKEVPAVS